LCRSPTTLRRVSAIVPIALITGLQQLGIDISLITQLTLIVPGAMPGGLTLAFAPGARRYVANLMGQSELARNFLGWRLRLDGVEGESVEIYRSGPTLATEEGLVSFQAARLSRNPSMGIEQGNPRRARQRSGTGADLRPGRFRPEEQLRAGSGGGPEGSLPESHGNQYLRFSLLSKRSAFVCQRLWHGADAPV
jgi:hypothetical protein